MYYKRWILQFRPAASLLAKELKRRLGLWVHLNIYSTPKGEHHGFGLHSDQTDGLIIQLEGDKLWEICGFSAPDISNMRSNGAIANMGTPHRRDEEEGACFCIVLCCFCIVLCCFMLSCAVLYRFVLFCIVFCCFVSFCAVLHHFMLFLCRFMLFLC